MKSLMAEMSGRSSKSCGLGTAHSVNLMTVSEVATLLRTTNTAIYAMVARDQIPGVVRIRRRLLFRWDELVLWLDQNREPSSKE